jgi:hypothetical protein
MKVAAVLIVPAVLGMHNLVAADDAPPVVSPLHVTAAPALTLGTHQYYNTGGVGGRVGAGLRASNGLGADLVFSVAWTSGYEGRSWADPFEPDNKVYTVSFGPRWDVPLGSYELSTGLHAGFQGLLFEPVGGFCGDVTVAFERVMTRRVRLGIFATGTIGRDGLYVEAGPAIRFFVGP